MKQETPEERIVAQLNRNIDGFRQKVAETNFYSAVEELRVAGAVIEAVLNTDPEEMTEERIELIARLAWAQSELQNGYATRCQDDLEGVEELSRLLNRQ